ncbi:uncharacterized protein [Parasteatoda tepidariorum]|uniref:uncharacterized protein n=1 Tax=Parasteatoda tepidariorum TaxID=114398 RepID=UPI0039BCA897
MLFDPIGLMNPFSIRIKLMLQQIWEKGISWDECIPTEIKDTFIDWCNELKIIRNLEIPRQYFEELDWESLEIHIFSDASPKCYGAVAYFRMKNITRFIMSKSRLAPLKKLTLPRIKGQSDDWRQFVRNRVIEIKEKTNPDHWHHCSGKDNPADKLTRGMNAQALLNETVWLSGPPWLKERNIPYDESASCPDLHNVVGERQKVVTLHLKTVSIQPLLNLDNYSDLNKVFRITGYIFRFIHNCKAAHEKRIGAITASELTNAETYWIKVVQRIEFEKEYLDLKNNSPIHPNSKLYDLNPILSADDLIALKGMLQNSDFDVQSKHPIIIPNKTKFTELLIFKEHKNLCHSGVSDTLTQLRERFWIIRGIPLAHFLQFIVTI